MIHHSHEDQQALWALIYRTLKPKDIDATPNACLNRLTNERPGVPRMRLNENTAIVRQERWSTEQLRTLDTKHQKVHEFDDDRPIIVVDLDKKRLLVDGNHRVARWVMKGESKLFEVLLVHPRENARAS